MCPMPPCRLVEQYEYLAWRSWSLVSIGSIPTLWVDILSKPDFAEIQPTVALKDLFFCTLLFYFPHLKLRVAPVRHGESR